MPTLPDILLIDVPVQFAGSQLPLGRYYPVLLETDAEADELHAFLDEDRAVPVAPALFERRPSALVAARISLARYAPPAAGWPWILLCHWPEELAALAPDTDSFARGAYTIEIFETEAEIAAFSQTMLSTLADSGIQEASLMTPGEIAGSA